MKTHVGISFAAAFLLLAGSVGASNIGAVQKATNGAASATYLTKPNSMPASVAHIVVEQQSPAGIIGQPIGSTPANGTTLTCNGTPLSTQTTQVIIRNVVSAPATATCSTTGAGFAVQQQPAGTIEGGGHSPVVVACTVPSLGAPAATGMLTCTVSNSVLVFPLVSLAQPAAVSIAVPATSLWARIGMVALLATLGALVIGLHRR